MLDFLKDNWGNLGLIIVGTFALVIYILQEHKKRIEAASLIVTQIDEIQDAIREMSTFIIDMSINETAFYEMLPIIDENYWNKYRHYFIRKIDANSYSSINNLFRYATEIQEQQILLKNLQKDYFFKTQNSMIQLETQSIANILFFSTNNAIVNENQFVIINNDNIYNKHEITKEYIKNFINRNAITYYIPEQIRISLQKVLNKCALLQVTGCSGYNKLRKISKKSF